LTDVGGTAVHSTAHRRAIRFVADHHDEPFFLFVSYLEPHHQNELDSYPAPEGYAQRYAGRWLPQDVAALTFPGDPAVQHVAGYCGQVKRLDEGLGRLRDALRSMSLTDRTIVAYTSDHGCHFRTRNTEYKRSCHDGSLRVPLALCGPASTAAAGPRHRCPLWIFRPRCWKRPASRCPRPCRATPCCGPTVLLSRSSR
jgi:arylsulfatase A-like enzyme